MIFTEHKDTLTYLEERLSKSGGYVAATIHGGKSVDERREAQWAFAGPDTQILIATDAAGEGINLQFCRLLINWDIPWNPNRLEQRMGRIHRHGQKQDVLENVNLDAIINSVFNGKETALDEFLAQNDEQLTIQFREKIQQQKNKLAHSTVDFRDARILKENSDEKRLQPIYIQLFFEKAFRELGGKFTELRTSIYRIDTLPEEIAHVLRTDYNIVADSVRQIQFCFDKKIFLDYQNVGDLGKVHYINPGNPVFDSLVKVVRTHYREAMLKGTILVSPDDSESYFAFFVKSQIVDNRESKRDDSIADERLLMVRHTPPATGFSLTSPAKFIDLHPPTTFAKP